jgi:hypothetical protein
MTAFQDGWPITMVGGNPTFDFTVPVVAFNPFGPSGGAATFNVVTARYLIDSARIRHHAFSDVNLGDGAALLFLNQRQREHLAKPGSTIEGLVGTTMQYTVGTGSPTGLFISASNGVPFLAAANGDGWCLHQDINGVPYVDPGEPQISCDPIGRAGSPQGFPLPGEMVRLVNVALVFGPQPPGGFIPCQIVNERARMTTMPGRDPAAFVSNNRLVPLMPMPAGTNNSGNRWYIVSAIQLSWVPVADIQSLDDQLQLPQILCGALIADLAALMANQSKVLSSAEKVQFTEAANQSGVIIQKAAMDMLDSPQSKTVNYRG